MKAIIVVPPSTFLDNDKVFPHLGPYYIKRYVEEHSSHNVKIVYKAPWDFSGADIIGFSATTPQYKEALKLAQSVDVKTILGGPHAHHYEIKDRIWDYIIKGDGCKPFLNILNQKEPGNELDDPDQLPHRDESLHDYKYLLDGQPTTVILTSRGCPNKCAFCEDAGKPVRMKSPLAVKREIQECVNLGFSGIMFFDDLFCLNEARVKNLTDIIKPFNIKFRCFAHARNFSEKMAKMLFDAGCVEIGYGAESLSQKILDTVNKHTTVQQNYDLVKIAQKYGIRVKAFLLLGLPGESKESASAMEKFVVESGIDDFDVSIYYPYKGTQIADNIEKYDLYIKDNETIGYYKGKCGSAECSVETSLLTNQEIGGWHDRIYAHNKRWKKS
jgi:anaerobic magnesium-protoporphyrin IX monomethyl ester cyclase